VAHRHEAAATLVESITKEVNGFCGEAPQFDDMTLVVVRRTG
jgi:serine phosphatase RsbU (regulator of sigma subunit)